MPAVELRCGATLVLLIVTGCTDSSASANCATRAPAADLVAFTTLPADALIDPTAGDATIPGSADGSFDWALVADGDSLLTGKPSLDEVFRYDADSMQGAATTDLIEGPLARERFGAAVARLGTRILVGAPDTSPTPARAGAGSVYLSTGFADPDTRVVGEAAEDHFGERLAACGDLDGDGVGDFAAAAVWADDLGGAVYIGSTALSGEVEAATLTRISGGTPAAQFGRAIICDEDLVGDDAPDVIIGAPFEPTAEGDPGAGAVYLYANAAQAAPTTVLLALAPNDAFGSAIAVGNLDGDAAPDLAIGAPGAWSGAGSVYIFLDQALDPTQIGYGLPTLELRAGTNGARFGSTLLLADLDADGLDDLLVGAPSYDPTGAGTKTIQAGAAWMFDAPTLTAAAGDVLFTDHASRSFQKEEGCLRTGERMAAPDLDADGVSDLVLLERATSD